MNKYFTLGMFLGWLTAMGICVVLTQGCYVGNPPTVCDPADLDCRNPFPALRPTFPDGGQ